MNHSVEIAAPTVAVGHDGAEGRPIKIANRNVNVWYGDKQALFDVSIDIPDRAVTAFIGPSGCGKSTFLRRDAPRSPRRPGASSRPDGVKLLEFLMQSPGRVFSREQLLDNVWGQNVYIDERTVDVHVGRLRKALNRPGRPGPIRTVRGAGYAFDETLMAA